MSTTMVLSLSKVLRSHFLFQVMPLMLRQSSRPKRLKRIFLLPWNKYLYVYHFGSISFQSSEISLLVSGNATDAETKTKVTAIHDQKERLKRESEAIKDIKRRLKEVQEKQKSEKDVSKKCNYCVQLEYCKTHYYCAPFNFTHFALGDDNAYITGADIRSK